ncbi:MAG: PqqD family protein [Clostridia bacterium]|nr:PqqD family protein [Clostridia bacterium]
MKLKDGFVLRNVGGHTIVVPVGAQTIDFNCMVTLNETGAFLWKQLQEERTAQELTEALLAEYEVEQSVAQADVERFAALLEEAELLV